MIKLKKTSIWINPDDISAIVFKNYEIRNGGDVYIYVPGMSKIVLSYNSYEEFYEDFKDILNEPKTEPKKATPLEKRNSPDNKSCSSCRFDNKKSFEFPCDRCYEYEQWEEKLDNES